MPDIGIPLKKYTVIPLTESIRPTHEPREKALPAPTKAPEKEKEPA